MSVFVARWVCGHMGVCDKNGFIFQRELSRIPSPWRFFIFGMKQIEVREIKICKKLILLLLWGKPKFMRRHLNMISASCGNCIFGVSFSRFERPSILFLFFAIMYEITFNSHIMGYTSIVRKAAYRTIPFIFGFRGNIGSSFLSSYSRRIRRRRELWSRLINFALHRAPCSSAL